jgi:hypothetical protein
MVRSEENILHDGMLHACACNDIESAKLLINDSRCDIKNSFCIYITAAHMRTSNLFNVNVHSQCINKRSDNNGLIRLLLDHVEIDKSNISVAIKYAVVYNYLDLLAKFLTVPII